MLFLFSYLTYGQRTSKKCITIRVLLYYTITIIVSLVRRSGICQARTRCSSPRAEVVLPLLSHAHRQRQAKSKKQPPSPKYWLAMMAAAVFWVHPSFWASPYILWCCVAMRSRLFLFHRLFFLTLNKYFAFEWNSTGTFSFMQVRVLHY